jgi:hypothetical protein
VRHIKIYTLSMGLGALSAVSLGGVSTGFVAGCARTCSDEYVECTSKPGLRYVECGGARWEFNDGRGFDSEGRALDYCYCGEGMVECIDNTFVSMCNTTPLDGNSIIVYDNNTSADLAPAIADCLGRPSCTLETAGCTHNGWYLDCGPGTYVTSYGEKTSQSAALESCAGGNGGHCVDAVEDCQELASCAASVACYDDYYDDGCQSFVSCYKNDDAASCLADAACKWETY